MLCPNCQTTLKKKVYKGVQVDECETCKGVFFDESELEKAKNNTDEDLTWLHSVLFHLPADGALQENNKLCPRCKSPMQSYEYAGSKVIVNQCSICKGIWLDHDEFEKIIRYLESLVTNHAAADYAEDMTEHFARILAGTPHEMEEFKDFFAVTKLFEMRFVAEHPTLEKILETYFELTPFK